MTKKKNLFSVIWDFLSPHKKKKTVGEQLRGYEVKFLKVRLEGLMDQQKPFLRPRYSINDMATDMQIPSYLLSSFLNNIMKINFSDFLNRYRIEYCQGMMRDRTTWSFSLKELAGKCGFNNRNTFTTAFKKFTGNTPSDYIKKLKLFTYQAKPERQ
jgi:AraC-like DNA-binding protein